MKIEGVIFYTNRLHEQYDFYVEQLGFTCIKNEQESFSIRAGSSILNFYKSIPVRECTPYHLAFTITEYDLSEVVSFLTNRNILPIEKENQIIFHFEDWNAKSVYFLDSDKNILEFIIRYNLKNKAGDSRFSVNEIVNISEVGIAVENPEKFVLKMKEEFGLEVWKENGPGFKAVGSEEGLMVVVPTDRCWFPTDKPAGPLPLIVRSKGFQIINRVL
jgi:hypothetical protein